VSVTVHNSEVSISLDHASVKGSEYPFEGQIPRWELLVRLWVFSFERNRLGSEVGPERANSFRSIFIENPGVGSFRLEVLWVLTSQELGDGNHESLVVRVNNTRLNILCSSECLTQEIYKLHVIEFTGHFVLAVVRRFNNHFIVSNLS